MNKRLVTMGLLICALAASAFGQGSSVFPYTTPYIRTVLDDATAGAAATTLALGVDDIVTHDALILDGTIAIGLDMSGGTFATAVQNWPTDPIIQIGGTQFIKNDSALNSLYIGTGAGVAVTTATNNILIGKDAGKLITTSPSNVLIGRVAGDALATGSGFNVGIGDNALGALISGNQNFALGEGSGRSLTTGSTNVLIGRQAGSLLGTGSRNTCIGASSGRSLVGAVNNNFIGNLSGEICTGNNNLFLGEESGKVFTGASSNVMIGHEVGKTANGIISAATESNLLAIGNQNPATNLPLIEGYFAAHASGPKIFLNANAVDFVAETDTDITHTYTATTNSGVLTWMEDEDYFQFADDVVAETVSTPQNTTTLGVGVTTVAITSNLVTLTGDGGGNTVATITGGLDGLLLTIIFVDANITITDTDAHTANTVDLAGTATDLTSADDTTLQVVYDGTSWYETSRSVN